MATEIKLKPSLLAVSDADWAEAVQRESGRAGAVWGDGGAAVRG